MYVLENVNIIIHLACISNDPSYELNPKLGEDINFTCFPKLINKINKFKLNNLYMPLLQVFMELKKSPLLQKI